METQSKEAKTSEEIVVQYALALSTMDLQPIIPFIDKDFKFVYRVKHDMGHGIKTDVRYIGHIYKTFLEMKREGLSIKTELCYLENEGAIYLSIKLQPPHDRRIIFPMDFRVHQTVRNFIPDTEVYFLPRIKKGLLCKVECYASIYELKRFNIKVGKIMYPSTSFQALAKIQEQQLSTQRQFTLEEMREQVARVKKQSISKNKKQR